MKPLSVVSLFLTAALAAPAESASLATVGSFGLMGGHSFFRGGSSTAGAAYLDVAPMVSFASRDYLLFRLHGRYDGTRSAFDVLEEGSVLIQQQDYGAGLKYVRPTGRSMKVKLDVEGGMTLLKDAPDERWGRGLYDSENASAGLELQMGGRKTAVKRWGLRATGTRYPHYRASYVLAGEELQGRRVLDNWGGLAYLIVENGAWEAELVGERSHYPDQRVVAEDGARTESLRWDAAGTLRLRREGSRRARRGSAWWDTEMTLRWRGSNQNHYDSLQARFIPRHYDYVSAALSPAAGWRFRRSGADVSITYAATYKSYLTRPIQDPETGAYETDKLRQWIHDAGLRFSYPLGGKLKGLSASLHVDRLQSRSNMRYERLYRYNHVTWSYLSGFHYIF